MSINHDDLVRRFSKGATKGKGSNMFIENDILYSYGHHFPLLVRMPWGFLQNADRYSVTTSSHQSHCRQYATVLVPFSALREAGINMYRTYGEIPDVNLIDKTEARFDTHTYTNEKGEEVTIQERRPESCVIEYKGKYLLSSMDNYNYFLTELPIPCDTVEKAFASLKPDMAQGIEGKDYLRQGEYFFIPLQSTVFRDMKKGKIVKGSHKESRKRWDDSIYTVPVIDNPLPAKNDNPHHYATENTSITGCPYPVVRGTVRHSQGDHRMMKLGNGKEWFIAVESNHVRSWGVNGKVD